MTFGRQLGEAVNPGARRFRRKTPGGITYTLTINDVGKLIELDDASNITVTVPLESSEDLGEGFQCTLMQKGTGSVTVVGEGGVVLNNSGGLTLPGQYSTADIIKTGTDEFIVSLGGGGSTHSAGKVLLDSQSITGNVNFTLDPAYEAFELFLVNVKFSSDLQYAYIRWSNDGGSTYISTADYARIGRARLDTGGEHTNHNSGGTLILLTDHNTYQVGNAAAEHLQFARCRFNVDPGAETGCMYDSIYGTSGRTIHWYGAAHLNGYTGINAGFVGFTGGANSGRFLLYGYAK